MKSIRWGMITLMMILFTETLSAQYPIKIQVDSMPTQKAYLLEYIGIRSTIIDSARADYKGKFTFTLPQDAHPGMYRVVVGPNHYWDILFNREPVELRTHFQGLIDSLKVIQSLDNQLLKRYMDRYILINRKSEALQRLLSLYEATDPFYQQVMQELQDLSGSDPDEIARDIIRSYPDSYVAKFLKTELAPRIPAEVPRGQELTYTLEHFFDGVDFADTTLLYSPALMGKVRQFFNLIPQAYPPREVEEAMKKGLDRLMSQAAVNDVLFQYILEDISEWAERTDFDGFFAYLTEFYLLDAACKDETRSEEIGEMLEAMKKTAIGITAPEIILPMKDGSTQLLSEVPATYRLVVFWASWCQHCQDMMPYLKRLYDRYDRQDLEIIAISLDETRSDWEAAIRAGEYNWINYSELKGWDCSIAHDYGIRATPTLILMDRNRVILSKPRDMQILESELRDRGITPKR